MLFKNFPSIRSAFDVLPTSGPNRILQIPAVLATNEKPAKVTMDALAGVVTDCQNSPRLLNDSVRQANPKMFFGLALHALHQTADLRFVPLIDQRSLADHGRIFTRTSLWKGRIHCQIG